MPLSEWGQWEGVENTPQSEHTQETPSCHCSVPGAAATLWPTEFLGKQWSLCRPSSLDSGLFIRAAISHLWLSSIRNVAHVSEDLSVLFLLNLNSWVVLCSCHFGLDTQPPSHLCWSPLGELGLCPIWHQWSWLRVTRGFALGHRAREWLRGNLNPGLLIPALDVPCSCSKAESCSVAGAQEERVLLTWQMKMSGSLWKEFPWPIWNCPQYLELHACTFLSCLAFKSAA